MFYTAQSNPFSPSSQTEPHPQTRTKPAAPSQPKPGLKPTKKPKPASPIKHSSTQTSHPPPSPRRHTPPQNSPGDTPPGQQPRSPPRCPWRRSPRPRYPTRAAQTAPRPTAPPSRPATPRTASPRGRRCRRRLLGRRRTRRRGGNDWFWFVSGGLVTRKRKGGGEKLRGCVEADDVSDCVWVGRDAPAEGEAFVIGLRDEGAALVVFFVPWLWWRGEGEGEEGEEGEEGQGVDKHLPGCFGWLPSYTRRRCWLYRVTQGGDAGDSKVERWTNVQAGLQASGVGGKEENKGLKICTA